VEQICSDKYSGCGFNCSTIANGTSIDNSNTTTVDLCNENEIQCGNEFVSCMNNGTDPCICNAVYYTCKGNGPCDVETVLE
jgi:hypothetical protein